MVLHSHALAALLWIGGALAVAAAERPAPSRLCPEDAPEGVRLPNRAGCGGTGPEKSVEDARGFRDMGGVKLRVVGRVGAEFGAGR